MKQINKIIVIFLIFLLAFCINISKGFTLNEDYSTEYMKWLELPDNEKDKYVMPSMYTINLDDTNKNTDYDISVFASDISLPSSYNTNAHLNLSVRDQGNTNSCWAISSIEMFEIANAIQNSINTPVMYSSRHLDYSCSRYFLNNVENMHGFNRRVGNGANIKVALAYFSSGKGPIREEDMPFVDNTDLIEISEIQNKTVQAQLRDYTEYPNIYKNYDENNNVTYSNGSNLRYSEEQIEEFRKMIKTQIMEHGAVGSYTYTPSSRNNNNYFSNDNGIICGNSYFCNNTSLAVNHAICIVGWDDTYSKNNFKEGCRPIHDGAYIALNSWGTNWNELDGYYYISYDDVFIENMMFGIQNVSNKEYDNIYQYDELGTDNYFISQNNPSVIYGANVFKRNTKYKDMLTDIGLYISDNGTNVKIYLDNSAENLDSINNLEYLGTFNNLTTGYHVIKLDTQKYLNNTFAILVEYSKEGIAKLPIEENFSTLGNDNMHKYYHTASSNPGESYVSENGVYWVDIASQYQDINVCIKAITKNSEILDENFDYIKNPIWNILVKNNIKILTGINDKTTISELLFDSNFASGYIIKAYKDGIEVTDGLVSTGTIIRIYENSKIVAEYTVVIYGDTNGDGNIASVDALSIIKNKLGTESFTNDIFAQAGKVTLNTRISNETPSAVDALAVIKHKLEIEYISQY